MSATNPSEPAEQGAAREPYHKGNVPQRLLEAAELLLQTETVEDITARRLCREIGVTSANFYNHYPSLDYLLLEIAAKGFEARSRMMTKLLRSHLSHEEVMISCAIQTVDLNLRHPQLFRIMFGYIKNPQQNANYVEKADESLAILTHIVYGEDIFRADDIKWSHDNCRKAYAFFAFIYGLAAAMSTNLISNPRGTRAARREFVAELTRTYLKPA